MSKPAVAYIRQSTAEQKRSGLGADAQRAAIEAFAAAEGFTILEVLEETASGKGADALERRPVLAQAVRVARRHKCPILVSRLDRLSRDVAFISGLMAQKVPFIVTALGANADPFMLHVYAALAQQERLLIAARTVAALQAKKQAGARLGNRTNLEEAQRLGAAATSRQADAFASNVLPIVRAIQAAGVTTRKGIAEALNARGVKTARGGAWHATSVARLLERGDQP